MTDQVINNTNYTDNIKLFSFAPFLFLNEHEEKYNLKFNQMFDNKNTFKDNDTETVRNLFFSAQNIDIVQKQLIMHIYRVSKKTFLIPRQIDDNMLQAMKYIYYEYGSNIPFNITDQIRDLNSKVIDLVSPRMLTFLQQYVGYINDINTYRPIDNPINVSAKGSRTLPSTSRFFFN